MQSFVGEILLGGARLKDLVGWLVDIPAGHDAIWQGHFHVDSSAQSLFELGRPYMLQLNDGRFGRVVVTRMAAAQDAASLRVDFETMG